MGGSRPTTWGLFSSNGKLLSSITLQLIHRVLFVTSKSGRSSSWTLRVGLEAGPPGQDIAVGFVFGHVFFFLLLGVHLCEARAQRAPLVRCRELGSIKIEPAGQHILALSAPQPDILFHC